MSVILTGFSGNDTMTGSGNLTDGGAHLSIAYT